MLADLHQIASEIFIIVFLQIVLTGIGVSGHASTLGHPPWGTVAESFKDGIGPEFLYLQHNLALSLVALPMELTSALILKSFHLGTQSFALSHVMLFAMSPGGIISSAYIISENVHVESVGTYQPFHQLGHIGVAPFATHIGPPAQAHAPSVYLLSA